MDRKIVTKILAALLAFILSFANVLLLGSYTGKTYAASSELEEQSTSVNKAKIEFDAYFIEEGEKVHSKIVDVENDEEKLYFSIKVEEGYLTNSKIKIENSNFNVVDNEEEHGLIQSISEENNEILLNQISRDESVILEVPIKIKAGSSFDVKDLSKIASITLEGTYVNNKGKEVKVGKTIETEVIIDGVAQSSLTSEVAKYVTYDVNGNKGVILQTIIKSKLIDNKLPVKSTKLEIEIPLINSIAPKEVTLSAKSLMATSGISGKTFNEEDYKYENGKITLMIENDDERLSWEKDAEDEIILNCIYNEEAIVEEYKLELNCNSQITYYAKEQKTIESETKLEKELKEQIGDIVTLDIEVLEDNLYKGYMMSEKGKNTSFVDYVNINIGYCELVDNIVFTDETSYISENESIYPSNALYTYTKIDKENLLEILGEDGYIEIYNKNKELIATLNQDNVEYIYEDGIENVTFKTSKPKIEGILGLENGRKIKPLEYSKTDIENFKSYKVNLIANIIKDEKVIISGQRSKEISLTSPETQAELTISKPNISTVITNEGVELRVTLKTTDSSTMLYKNPKIEIVLPKYVTNIRIENVKLLYEKELKLSSAKMYRNINGNIVIEVALQGEQTTYNEEAITEGATILMNADITVDALTPTKTEDIILNVQNENTNEVLTNIDKMNFIAPSGLVTVNQISGYNDKNEKTISISGKKEVGEIEIQSEAKTAEVVMTVINNYNYNIENVRILGRTPFKGNKSIKTGEDLGSTFTAKVVEGIRASAGIQNEEMTVYYSSNENATSDLRDVQNEWTSNISDLSEVKSFMIILNNYPLNIGEAVSFGYNVEIPAGLNHNQETYGIFTVYYTRQAEEQKEDENTELAVNNSIQIATSDMSTLTRTIEGETRADEEPVFEESIESGPSGVATRQGINLNVELTASYNGANLENDEKVSEFTQIKYTVKVKNESNSVAKDVDLTFDIPNRASFVKQNGWNEENSIATYRINEIEAGKTETVTFSLRTRGYIPAPKNSNGNKINNDEENTIKVKVTAQSTGDTTRFSSNEIANIILSAEATGNAVLNVSAGSSNGGLYFRDTQGRFYLTATVTSLASSTNVNVSYTLPSTIEWVSGGNYNSENRTVTWNLGNMNASDAQVCSVEVKTVPLNGTYKGEIPVEFIATCNESELKFKNTEYKKYSYKDGFELTLTNNVSNGYLSEGENIRYEATVTNLSPVASEVTIKTELSQGLQFVKLYYTESGKTVEKVNGSSILLGANETLKVYIEAKAQKATTNKEVTNTVTLSSDYIDTLTETNKHTLLGSSGGNPENPGDNDNPENENKVYRISGTAWLDENKDGKRDSEEKLLSGIKVLLLDSRTNEVVSNTVTTNNGTYIFIDITQGNYIVVFEYDTKSYDLTSYQADGVEESNNSDAIAMTLKLNGTLGKYAATNTINLNSNMYNIDLGLVDSPKFDLSFEKSISLIQVSNSKGVKNYKFNNADLAKVEIAEKNLPGSVVAITYTFKVKNEGAVSGYVNKIVDYKAKDLSFSSTLNPEWYQDTDGNIYNTTLSNTEIKPGEEAELSLILTKTMTNENVGLTNNSAELIEVSNDLGLSDIDSTPGNKNTSEDDYGKADVIIAINTGGILLYTGIVFAVLAIFALGAYEINKRVLRKI